MRVFFTRCIALWRIITWKKLFNLLLLWFQYILSVLSGRYIRTARIHSIAIEPCNICQLHCPECPSGNGSLQRAKGMISPSLFYDIIDTTSPYLTNLTLYFQGEPFLHPSIIDMISYAVKKNIYVNTSTNAQCITSELATSIVNTRLHRIIISMDGLTQTDYAQYRIGGSLQRTLDAINLLNKAKKEHHSSFPHIEVQCLILSTTENHLKDIRSLALAAGADSVTFKSAQFYHLQSELMPQKKHSNNRYEHTAQGEIIRKASRRRACYRAWNSIVITWDGKVVPCCFDKDAQYAYSTWNGDFWRKMNSNNNYKNLLSTLLKNRKSIPMCNNCNV